MTQTKRLNKQELRRINLRWIWNSQIGWNYERMQGLGYLTTMLLGIVHNLIPLLCGILNML